MVGWGNEEHRDTGDLPKCCRLLQGLRWLQSLAPDPLALFFFSFYTPASLLAALLLVCTPAPCSVRPFQWLWRQQMRPPQQCSAGAVLIDLTSSGWWMADCDGLPGWTGLGWPDLTCGHLREMGGQLDGLDGLTDKRIGQDIEVEWRWSCLLTGESHSKAMHGVQDSTHDATQRLLTTLCFALLCSISSAPATGT